MTIDVNAQVERTVRVRLDLSEEAAKVLMAMLQNPFPGEATGDATHRLRFAVWEALQAQGVRP